MKNSIFDDGFTDERNNSASSEDEGRGKWSRVKRKKKGKQCRDCDVNTDHGKIASSGLQHKGKHEKVTEKGSLCGGNCQKQCGKPVLNDAMGGIACDTCLQWYHPSCQELTDEAYKMLRDAKLVWLCSQCRTQLPKFRSVIRDAGVGVGKEPESMMEVMTVIGKEIDDLKKKQFEYQKKLEDTVLECATRLENSVQDSAKHTMASVVDKTEDIMAKVGHHVVGEVNNKLDKVMEAQLGRLDKVERVVGNSMATVEKVAEESQKAALSLPKISEEVKNSAQKVAKMMGKEADEARKRNILVHNVEESKAQDPKQRREDDEKAFQFMTSALLGEQSNIKVERIVRLGRRVDGPDIKPRLLLVTLKDTDQVEKMYHNRFGLKEVGLSNIYITKDLPPAEREAQRKLRQELADKGRDKYCIFRGSVILREDRYRYAKP